MKANEKMKNVKTSRVAPRTLESEYIFDHRLPDSMKSLADERLSDLKLVSQGIDRAMTGLLAKKNREKESRHTRPCLVVNIDRNFFNHEDCTKYRNPGSAKIVSIFGSKNQSGNKALSPMKILCEAKSDPQHTLNPDHLPAA